uniref:NADH-ubiquinone oxidoreductase chain 4L n=1 Tax=Mutela dubia TaxID=152234 RepID=A0A1X9JQ85_9BIVA|nr:NADH dehydrogenase subunit 4L [Mutela dubia]AQT38521.1 NADH dehydrogenase subunit 4L [Mutela dubia]
MLSFSMVGVGAIGVICGICCMCSQRKSLFGLLLGMEVFTLAVYVMVLDFFNYLGGSANMCLVFLVFGVCEAALGLSVLVFLVRLSGSEYVSSSSLGHF